MFTTTWVAVVAGRPQGARSWRRERDSNPRRAFDPYTLSRGAPSTTRPSLRGEEDRSASTAWCAGARRARGGNHTQTQVCAAKRAPVAPSGRQAGAHELLHRLERRVERLRLAAPRLREVR